MLTGNCRIFLLMHTSSNCFPGFQHVDYNTYFKNETTTREYRLQNMRLDV